MGGLVQLKALLVKGGLPWLKCGLVWHAVGLVWHAVGLVCQVGRRFGKKGVGHLRTKGGTIGSARLGALLANRLVEWLLLDSIPASATAKAAVYAARANLERG